tara:strand:+ start:498 stop:2432 length:1935 start_codon:yes stop_codon:yes gene_type:complete
MAVFGDFGGQPVRLDNAATEDTLQRLVEVAQQGFGSAGNNLNAAGQAAGRLGRAANKTGDQLSGTGDAANSATGSLRQATSAGIGFARSIDRSGARMAQGMRTMSSSPFMVADTMVNIMDSFKDGSGGILKGLGVTAAAGLTGAFITAGDKMEGAATGVIAGLGMTLAPALTSMFAGMFVRVLKDTTENFTNLQKNGAILGGSLTEARLAAHGAGLTLGQFTNVMGKAGADMAMFGGQTRRGAQLFGDLNKAVTTGDTGRQLLQLGIGFEDMGIRTAEMIAHLTESGINFENNAVAVATARDRVVELAKQQKALAAINGTTIEQEKEKQRMARKDAQLNAIMLGMGEKEREGIQQLTTQFPQFSQFIKETVAFGGPVTKGALMQQAQMGATTEALGNTIQQVLAGGGQGAIDAFKQLQETSPALQRDLQNQAELVKLSLVSQNEFIQTAQQNFQSQFELLAKSNARVVDSVLEDFQRMEQPTDDLTKTIVKLQSEQQALTVEMTKTATALISQSGAIQDIMVGTTETLRTALQNINEGMGVEGRLNVQTGNVTSGDNTAPRNPNNMLASLATIPDQLQEANAEDTAEDNTGNAAAQGNTGLAGAGTIGPVPTTDPVVTGLLTTQNTTLNDIKRSMQQMVTNTQN